ncbi:MAG: DUF167 domain-containing protein [Sneathiella sp.]
MRIRVTPNASANRVDGWNERADGQCWLKVKITAVPEKGKANKALIKWLTRVLGYAQRDFELIQGETDRNKTVLIAGEANTVIKDLKRKFAEFQ